MIRRALPVLALVLVPGPARAADPLDCVPGSAQLVVASDSPRKLAEAVTGLGAFQQAQALPQYRAVYDSAAARRGFQLLAMFEKELGATWPDLLDQLAGGGAAIGIQFAADPAPAILVLQGRDEAQVKKALDLIAAAIDAERARQGSAEKLKWSDLAGHPSARLGDAHVARVGPTVLLSNNEAMLKAGVLLAQAPDPKGPPHPARRDAFRLLPRDPLAWLWVDLASVKRSKAAKDFFDTTRQNVLHTVVAGGTIDCLKRADCVAAGLYRDGAGFRLAVRLPAGRDGFPPEYQLHVPPKGRPGSLPLLEPPGTIYTHSLHLDVGFLWKNRAKLLGDEVRGQLEQAERDVSKVLPGRARVGELLEMWGPHHRVVAANHDALPYKKAPGQRFPAFGYVATGADPKFARAVEPALRSAALLASLQFGMKMSESEHAGAAIVAYRFPEDKDLAYDPDGTRFNFEPCFAIAGDALVVASTVELCKKLVTELKATRATGETSAAVIRGKFSAAGAADALAGQPDPLITDAILARGIGLGAARKEVADLVAWVRTLGAGRVELEIAEKEYKLDLVWELAPGK